ncbi:MAG TPA: phosphatase PAP2 family protein [Candidatus Angelobacter sp.]|nr:phosphatase PAP2 family protein [Candidatus Angelobacter sp.]
MTVSARPELPAAERTPPPTPLMDVGLLVSLGAAALLLFLFAWIAEEMGEGATMRFDLAVRDWVHQFASPGMTRAMTVISMLGYYTLAVELVVALAVFLYLGWKHAAGWLAASAAGALVLELALKQAFHRPRPQTYFGAAPHSYSFPSGHALFSFCFYAVLAGLIVERTQSTLLKIVVGVVAAVLIVAIGLSRIYLGMHYPSDVVAGYVAAAIWVSTLLTLDRWRKRRKAKPADPQS